MTIYSKAREINDSIINGQKRQAKEMLSELTGKELLEVASIIQTTWGVDNANELLSNIMGLWE